MIADFVKETVSAGGTGNLTLGGAVSGFMTFNAVTGTDKPFQYVIEDGTNRECGIGHMSASATLVRDRIVWKLASGTYSEEPVTGLTVTTSAEVMLAPSAVNPGGSSPPFVASNGTDVALVSAHVAATIAAAPFSFVLDYAVYSPYLLTRPGNCSGVIYNVTTTGTATLMRVGLYSVGTDGKPDNKLAETGDITTFATGFTAASWGAGNVFLYPGWYYIANAANAADTQGQGTPHGDFALQPPTGIRANTYLQQLHGFSENLGASWTALPATPSLTELQYWRHAPRFALEFV